MQSPLKYYTFLFASFLLCFAALGQETKIVDIHSPNIDDNFNGVYYKDLNGIYDPYLGVWKGEANGRLYEFHIVKFIKVRHDFRLGKFHFKDEVRIKFEVRDVGTQFILYSSLSALARNDYPIFGDITAELTIFYFSDSIQNCYNEALFGLERVIENPNQLNYANYRYLGPQKPTCSYASPADIPIFLPTQNLVLAKQ